MQRRETASTNSNSALIIQRLETPPIRRGRARGRLQLLNSLAIGSFVLLNLLNKTLAQENNCTNVNLFLHYDLGWSQPGWVNNYWIELICIEAINALDLKTRNGAAFWRSNNLLGALMYEFVNTTGVERSFCVFNPDSVTNNNTFNQTFELVSSFGQGNGTIYPLSNENNWNQSFPYGGPNGTINYYQATNQTSWPRIARCIPAVIYGMLVGPYTGEPTAAPTPTPNITHTEVPRGFNYGMNVILPVCLSFAAFILAFISYLLIQNCRRQNAAAPAQELSAAVENQSSKAVVEEIKEYNKNDSELRPTF